MPWGPATSETDDAAGSESDKSDTIMIIYLGWGGGFLLLAALIACCICFMWKHGRNKERVGVQLGAYQQGNNNTATGDSPINHFKRSLQKAENQFNADGAIKQNEQEVLKRAIHSYLDNNLTNSRGLLKEIVGNDVYKALLKGSNELALIDYMNNMEPSSLEQLVGTLSPVKKECINFIATIEEQSLPFASAGLLGAGCYYNSLLNSSTIEEGLQDVEKDTQTTALQTGSLLDTTPARPTNITIV